MPPQRVPVLSDRSGERNEWTIEAGQGKRRLPIDPPKGFRNAFRFVPFAPEHSGEFENGQPLRHVPQHVGKVGCRNLPIDRLKFQRFVRTPNGLTEPFEERHEMRNTCPAYIPQSLDLGGKGSRVPEPTGLEQDVSLGSRGLFCQ